MYAGRPDEAILQERRADPGRHGMPSCLAPAKGTLSNLGRLLSPADIDGAILELGAIR